MDIPPTAATGATEGEGESKLDTRPVSLLLDQREATRHTKTPKGAQLFRHGYEENNSTQETKQKASSSLTLDVVLSRIAVKKEDRNVSITKITEKLHHIPYEIPKYLSRFIHELHTRDFSLYPNEKKEKRHAI